MERFRKVDDKLCNAAVGTSLFLLTLRDYCIVAFPGGFVLFVLLVINLGDQFPDRQTAPWWVGVLSACLAFSASVCLRFLCPKLWSFCLTFISSFCAEVSKGR